MYLHIHIHSRNVHTAANPSIHPHTRPHHMREWSHQQAGRQADGLAYPSSYTHTPKTPIHPPPASPSLPVSPPLLISQLSTQRVGVSVSMVCIYHRRIITEWTISIYGYTYGAGHIHPSIHRSIRLFVQLFIYQLSPLTPLVRAPPCRKSRRPPSRGPRRSPHMDGRRPSLSRSLSNSPRPPPLCVNP